ncbi:hypothetical protein AB0L33_02610 [Streptomyces sp. NPDC052299]|uniref:hypothetical protein n=1 Tax=Streptomyces sp. NPDC052299 TaxID=3155054 RepID=UPI0034225C4C
MSYANTDQVQLAGDILDWAGTLNGTVKTLAVSIAGTLAVVATVMAYWKTKSWAGTLAAAVLGAVLVFAVSNIDSLSNMVDSEVPDEDSVGALSVTGTEPLGQTIVIPAHLR